MTAWIVVALLVYIARKLQQLLRVARHEPSTPWWWEIADALNRIRPGTF